VSAASAGQASASLSSGGEKRADRPGRVHAERQDLRVAHRVDLARQARHFLALGIEQHHRRIAADVKAGADLLRARAVAVDVDRHEAARALDEVLPVEERRLDLVARRAPLRAPVDEDGLVGAARVGERGVDLGVARGLLPGDAVDVIGGGRGRGRCHGGGGRRRRRDSFGRLAAAEQQKGGRGGGRERGAESRY
jgi:hypothetical protein